MKRVAIACACGYALLAPLLLANPDIELQSGGVPPTGVVGVAYSGAFRARRGTEPYTFSIASGSLPSGLSVSPAGDVTGTPSVAGVFIFTARVTDKDGDSDTRAFTITIAPALVPPLAITTTSPLPGGAVGAAYSQSLSASGGSPPYRWTGSPPAGLTLASSGSITGTPTAAGSFNFKATVTDSASRTANRDFAITISPPALTITTTSPLPNGTVGAAYSQSLGASGGSPPYRWTGSPPAGLTLASSGSITGTPTAAGSFNFTATVTDSASRTANRDFAITISAPAPALTITTASPLPNGVLGTSYSQTLSASGGVPPYRWSGSAPAGLTLASNGVVSGTLSMAGTFNFTATVTDSASRTANRDFAITISVPEPELTITTTSPLPNGVVGTSYSQTLSASGGVPPYRWSGSVPAGLTLASNGVVSGTLSTAGAFNFTATVTDSRSATSSRSFAITIEPGALTITSGALPTGLVGAPYSQQLSASGGTPPLSWSVTAGQLPAGLSLSPSTGLISGSPTAAGSYNFTAQARDTAGNLTSKQFSISIEQGLTILTASPLPGGTAGAAYARTIQAAGGSPPYSWSLTSGALSPGLTLNSSSGLVSGLPNASVSVNFTLQVRDSRGTNTSKPFTLNIARALTITSPSPLPETSPGAIYNLPLSVDGGTPPFLWSIAGGTPPPGLSIDSATGVISGTVSGEGQFTFSVQVADGAGASSSRQFSLTVRGTVAPPSLTVGSVPEVVEATRQLTVDLILTSAAVSPVTGQVSLRFIPDTTIGSDDPAVQFSTGGRSASFTIPANATQPASPIALQTGSVAGVIELQFNAPSAGVTAMTRTIRVPRSAPAIGNLRLNRNATGFELRLVGFSTTRELTAAAIRFVGTALDTTELRVPLTESARGWYQSETSSRFGSQFALTLPFTVQGASSSIRSATLTLINTEGESQPSTVEFALP